MKLVGCSRTFLPFQGRKYEDVCQISHHYHEAVQELASHLFHHAGITRTVQNKLVTNSIFRLQRIPAFIIKSTWNIKTATHITVGGTWSGGGGGRGFNRPRSPKRNETAATHSAQYRVHTRSHERPLMQLYPLSI